MRLTVAANPFDHEDLLGDAISAYATSDDAMVDGCMVSEAIIRGLFDAGLSGGSLELVVIEEEGFVVGIAVISRGDRWLNGHLLYVLPEHRGHGIVNRHLGPMMQLARSFGLEGFRLMSTSAKWSGDGRMRVSGSIIQKNGVPVFDYRRTA